MIACEQSITNCMYQQNNKTSVACANGIQLLLFNNECVAHFPQLVQDMNT